MVGFREGKNGDSKEGASYINSSNEWGKPNGIFSRSGCGFRAPYVAYRCWVGEIFYFDGNTDDTSHVFW